MIINNWTMHLRWVISCILNEDKHITSSKKWGRYIIARVLIQCRIQYFIASGVDKNFTPKGYMVCGCYKGQVMAWGEPSWSTFLQHSTFHSFLHDKIFYRKGQMVHDCHDGRVMAKGEPRRGIVLQHGGHSILRKHFCRGWFGCLWKICSFPDNCFKWFV